MRVLVWQWGRMGSGPRFAAMLAEGLASCDGVVPLLSLSRRADVLAGENPPRCDLAVETYGGPVGFVLRVLQAPLLAHLRAFTPGFRDLPAKVPVLQPSHRQNRL
jgi:hypothetical protein